MSENNSRSWVRNKGFYPARSSEGLNPFPSEILGGWFYTSSPFPPPFHLFLLSLRTVSPRIVWVLDRGRNQSTIGVFSLAWVEFFFFFHFFSLKKKRKQWKSLRQHVDNTIFFYLSDGLSTSTFCFVKSWHFLTKCYFLPVSAIQLEKGIFLQVIW